MDLDMKDDPEIDHFILKKYRNDKKYLPVLLNNIQNPIIRERIANEVYSYVYGAYKYKRRYYLLNTLSVALPAAVVAINTIPIIDEAIVQIIISILSLISAIIGMLSVKMKTKESWIRNRKYAEIAKKEIASCVARIGTYKGIGTEAEEKLLQRLEVIFSEETAYWQAMRDEEE